MFYAAQWYMELFYTVYWKVYKSIKLDTAASLFGLVLWKYLWNKSS